MSPNGKRVNLGGPVGWLLAVSAVVILAAAAKLAEDILVPVVVALTLGVVVAPLTVSVERLGFPRALGAFAVLLLTLSVIAGVAFALDPTVRELIERAPSIWIQVRERFGWFIDILRGIDEVSREVEAQVSPGSESAGGGSSVDVPDSTHALLFVPKLAAQMLIFLGTLLFFLLERQAIYGKVETLMGRTSGQWQGRIYAAEAAVSRYFLTILAINCVFGIVVTIAMSIIGMPSPAVWGLIAALLNFILYLGPALVAVALAIAGQVFFDGAYALVPPAVFLSLNLIEGYFTTPMLVGRSLSVNPLVVFLSLTFWLWLWGPAGGVIALPLTVWAMSMAGLISFDATKKPAAERQSQTSRAP